VAKCNAADSEDVEVSLPELLAELEPPVEELVSLPLEPTTVVPRGTSRNLLAKAFQKCQSSCSRLELIQGEIVVEESVASLIELVMHLLVLLPSHVAAEVTQVLCFLGVL